MILKHNPSLTLVALLHALILPTAVFGCLYLTTRFYGVAFDQRFQLLSVIVVSISAVLLRSTGDFTEHLTSRRVPLAVGIIIRWFAIIGLLLAIGYGTKLSAEFSRRVVLTWATVTPAVLILTLLAIRELTRKLLMDPTNARSVVFVGWNDVSLSLSERIQTNAELCMKVVGFFDDRSAERLSISPGNELLGRLPEVASYVRSHRTEVVFIALPVRQMSRVMDLMDQLRDTTASIYYIPDIMGFDLIQARTAQIMGIPVVSMCETPLHGVPAVTKRITDVLFSLLILIPVLPVMLLIALLVKLSSPGSIFFSQRRYGLDGREITIYKFRTMTVSEDGHRIEQAMKDDGRITPIGRILRRYSLDELPQLLNVLQGRMSLVGPRPHAVAHNEEYRKLIKGYMIRHKVLPGITGLAQVNGCRGETARLEDMQARVNYDLDYLRQWSPMLDFKILALTALRLLVDKRAY